MISKIFPNSDCHDHEPSETLSRRLLLLSAALFAGTTGVKAQTAPTPSSSANKEEQPVMLEAFEVVMTQDKGYHTS